MGHRPTKRARKALILSAKIVLAAGLLGWVLSQVHWHDYVKDKADGATSAVLGVTGGGGEPVELRVSRGLLWWRREALGFGLSMLIIAVRWRMLLGIQDIHIGLWEAVRLTFLGQFFNAVVPGTVGGDLVKAYYVAKHTPKKAAVLVSVFVDRLMGLIELTLMAAVMIGLILLSGRAFPKMRQAAISIGVILAVIVGILTFLLSRSFRRALHLERLYRRLPIAHHFAAAGDAATLYRRRLGALCLAVLVTFGAHVAFVGFVALTGVSLSVQTDWYNYFVYVPLIYIIGAIPLTPGGVGLIEGLYVDLFKSPQCGPSTVLVLAMLARLVPVLWGLPGAVVAVTGARVPKAESMRAELGVQQQPPQPPR